MVTTLTTVVQNEATNVIEPKRSINLVLDTNVSL